MSIATLKQNLRNTLRHGRNRSILTYFVTSLSGRGIGILCQFVQVPLALRYLGKEGFGVWVTLASISYLINFSDFGIGTGAQNQMTEALGVGDHARARKLCLTTLLFLCGVAAVLMAVGVPTFLSLPWGRLFKLGDPALVRAMPGAMTGFLVLACLNVPLGIYRRLAFATQQAWLDNLAAMAGSVLSLAGIYFSASFRVGFGSFVVISWLPGLLTSLTGLVYQWTRLTWLRTGESWFDLAALRGLLNLGLLFAVQQVCSLVLFAGPSLLISTLLGAAALAPYNLVQRIFNVFQMFQNAFLIPLWPAYADAKAKRDWHWMGRTLRRSMLATLGVAVVPMIGVAFVTRPLIRLWTGTGISVPTAGLVFALLLWNIVVAVQQPLGFFLAGVSEIKRSMLYSLLTTVCAGTLMPLLAPRFGVNGIIMGLIIGNTAFSLVGCAYEVWRYFQRLAGIAGAAGQEPLPAAAASVPKTL